LGSASKVRGRDIACDGFGRPLNKAFSVARQHVGLDAIHSPSKLKEGEVVGASKQLGKLGRELPKLLSAEVYAWSARARRHTGFIA
jgi:hypothetical protein